MEEMKDMERGKYQREKKIIKGGLRYMENYELRMVREEMMEREVMWENEMNIINKMSLVMNYNKGGISKEWMLRIGMFI